MLSEKIKTDFRCEYKKYDWGKISLDLIIFLLLTSFGILVRLLFAYYSRKYYFSTAGIEGIWNRTVQFSPMGFPIGGFDDFNNYYVKWSNLWYNENWNPYRWPEPFEKEPINMYSYPPLFLYFLVSLWRPGFSSIWIAFPLIITDSMCAGVVYLILREIKPAKEKRLFSILGGLILAIAPINLVYIGIYWLNPGPVTFFTIISIYFIIKKKWRSVFFFLALATTTKQNALFLAYPLLMLMLGEKLSTKSIKKSIFECTLNVLVYLVVIFFVSMPWIFATPKYYLYHLAFPGKMPSLDPEIVTEPYFCVQFSRSLLELGISGWFLDLTASAINSMLLMILTATIISMVTLWLSYKKKLDFFNICGWLSVYLIFTHIFMPRGIFKFYIAYFIPIILIYLVGFHHEKISDEITLIPMSIIFLGFNVLILLINRYLVPLLLFLLAIVIIITEILRISFRAKKDLIKSLNP